MSEFNYTDWMQQNKVGPYTKASLKESHGANDKWYEDFENGLRNLVTNNYIDKYSYKYYMDALDHVDPMDNYSHLSGHDAAKEFVDDLRTQSAMDKDREKFKRETGLRESESDKIFQKYAPTLLKALTMRSENPEDIDAHDAVKKVLETIASALGLDSSLPFMEDEYFSGQYSPKEALEYAKEMFHDWKNEKGAGLEELDPRIRAEKGIDEEWDSPYDGGSDDLTAMGKKPNYQDPYYLATAVADAHPELKKLKSGDVVTFQRAALNYAAELMKAGGESDTVQINLINGYADEDWPSDFITALNKELMEVREWEEGDEEEDEEEPYENDMDNLDTTLPKESSVDEYYDKDALQSQAFDLDRDRSLSFSADWDDSNFESDQKEYLKKLAWVLRQKGASDQEIKKVFKDSYLLGKDRIRKSYYDIYQNVKDWKKKTSKVTPSKETDVLKEQSGDNKFTAKVTVDVVFDQGAAYEGKELEDRYYSDVTTMNVNYLIDIELRSWGLKSVAVYAPSGEPNIEFEIQVAGQNGKDEFIPFKGAIDWSKVEIEREYGEEGFLINPHTIELQFDKNCKFDQGTVMY